MGELSIPEPEVVDINVSLTNWNNRSRQMAQQSKTLALAEDQTSNSQQPHGGSQLSITPVPGDPMLPSDLLWHQACMWHTDITIRDKKTKDE